jgi:HSP20 family molecular chaperone IbpA
MLQTILNSYFETKNGWYKYTDTGLVAELNLLGFSKDEISITVTDRVIKILAKKSEDSFSLFKIEDKNTSLEIPDKFDITKTSVKYTGGILRFDIPLAEAANKKSYSIEIN